TVAIGVSNHVLKRHLTFFTICRRVGKGAIAVVNKITVTTERAVNKLNTRCQIHTVSTAFVISKDVNRDRLVFFILDDLVTLGDLAIITDPDRQIRLGRDVTITISCTNLEPVLNLVKRTNIVVIIVLNRTIQLVRPS